MRSVRAAGRPGVGVVGVAPGAGDVAAFGAAGGVADQECLALGGAEEPAGAAEVEGHTVAAEDGGDDLRGARQASGVGCGDEVTGRLITGHQTTTEEVGGRQLRAQRLERDGDDESGGVTAVDREPGRVEGLEEPTERLPEPLRVGQPGERITAFVVVGEAAAVCAGVGDGFEERREPGRTRVRHPPGDAGGAVTEAAHREAGLLGGVGLELGQPARLSLLGDLGGDHVEDPPPEPGELLRPEHRQPGRPGVPRRGRRCPRRHLQGVR